MSRANNQWVILQVRPVVVPEWWPKEGKCAAWGTCFPDGSGYSMVFDPKCVLPARHLDELKEEWQADHDGEWEFRTLTGTAPKKRRKKRVAL